jgi:hypothetical protein
VDFADCVDRVQLRETGRNSIDSTWQRWFPPDTTMLAGLRIDAFVRRRSIRKCWPGSKSTGWMNSRIRLGSIRAAMCASY